MGVSRSSALRGVNMVQLRGGMGTPEANRQLVFGVLREAKSGWGLTRGVQRQPMLRPMLTALVIGMKTWLARLGEGLHHPQHQHLGPLGQARALWRRPSSTVFFYLGYI